MLKQRLITAAMLLAVVISAILYLPTPGLAALFGVVLTLGAREWARLMKGARTESSTLLPVVLVLALLPLWFVRDNAFLMLVTLGAATLGWCVVITLLPRGDKCPTLNTHGMLTQLLVGVFVLIPPWLALTYLHGAAHYGPAVVLFLIGLVAVADSAAYFSGRAFGKHKLAPHISPGKTWEGVVGAMIATAVYGAAGAHWFSMHGLGRVLFVALCMVTTVFSIAGDLFESLVKRQAGVKDSGALLPGHGGVLDRIDSMTSAAPVFALGLWLLEGL